MISVCSLCTAHAGLASSRCSDCERRQLFIPDKACRLDRAIEGKQPLTLADLSILPPEERLALLMWALSWIRRHDDPPD